MLPTRRCWVTGGIGVALLALFALTGSVPYLVGAVGVGAFVLADAIAFAGRARRVVEDVQVTQTLSPTSVLEGRPVQLTTELVTNAPVDCVAAVECDAPLAATHVDGRTRRTVDAGSSTGDDETTVSGVTTVRVFGTYELPVPGRFAFGAPTLELASPQGLFTERVACGDAVSCTVEPSTPTDVVVGESGTRISLGVGEHDALIGGSGFTPGDLREYTASDPQSRIDWKTTARQGEPYVRDFEAAGELETLLFVDHRESTAVGPEGRRALDYLRSVALSLVDRAAAADDPVGLFTLGDDGITGRFAPSANTTQYRRVKTALFDVDASTGTTDGRRSRARRPVQPRPGEETAFDRTLAAYTETVQGFVEQVTEDPLFRTVETTLARTRGEPWVVLFTTDARPAEVLETVRGLGSRVAHVTVFVAPTVLFEEDSLTDLDGAYDRYSEFESFRRRLVGDGVDAYEVAPGDRLDAVLAAGTGRRTDASTAQSDVSGGSR
ncbi:DUF58 domain-containing protein [Halorubellus litoreus]|uniref:DUF58 domain-containing protein n=1 Tax=Halorubellus litoreus TaxID=755308 RepID=A0ABD5VHS0_9EURY